MIYISGCRKPETKEGGKILLRWSAYGYEAYDKFRYEYSKKFEKINPNVKVKYEPIVGDYASKILTQLASNTAPDIFFIPDGVGPTDLAKKGALLDLTRYIERDKEYFDQIHESLMEAQKYNGRIYALPNNCNTDVLFYNQNLFKDAGLAEPDESWDWQKLLEAAIRLTKKDESGRVTQFGLIPGYEWNFVFANGGKVWNEDRTKCIVNSQETREAFQFLNDLRYKYHVSPTISDYHQQGGIEMFSSGRVAMYIGGRWLTAAFKIKKRTELNWSIVPIPKGKRGRATRLDLNCMGIWSRTKHPDLAFEMLKFLVSPESIKFLIEVGDSQPIRWKGEEVDFFLNEPHSEGKNGIYLNAMDYAFSINQIYSTKVPYNQQKTIIIQSLDKMNLGQEPVELALENLEKNINKFLEKNK